VRQPDGKVVKLLGMKDAKGYASTAGDLFCEGQAGMNGVCRRSQLRRKPVHLRLFDVEPDRPWDQPCHPAEGQRNRHRGVRPRRHRSDIQYKPRASNHPFAVPVRTTGAAFASARATAISTVTTGDTHNGVVPQSPTLIGGKVPAHRSRRQRPLRAMARRRASTLASTPMASEPARHHLQAGHQPAVHRRKRTLAH